MLFDNLDDYRAARGLFGPDGKPLAGAEPTGNRVEITRSISFKLNLGNYQSMDFFCSQKAQCDAAEADQTAADLSEWCYDQVMQDVAKVKSIQARKEAARENRSNAA